MNMQQQPSNTCSNEGCGRPAPVGERLCEICGLEWALFRRDRRAEPAGSAWVEAPRPAR